MPDRTKYSRRDFLFRPLRGTINDSETQNSYKQGEIPDYYKSSDKQLNVRPEYSIVSDFNSEQLYYELMSKGIDPSNLNEDQMRQVLYDLM